MTNKLAMVAALTVVGALPAAAQRRSGPVVVATIETVHADSAGRAYRGRRLLSQHELDSITARLRTQPGATIWFSWDGGPGHIRTPAQEGVLYRLRETGIRVELRSDSTMRSRVVLERPPE